MRRDDAIAELATLPEYDPRLIELVQKRLGFTPEQFAAAMDLPRKTFRDFDTYKPTFERLRPLFWLLSRFDLVPKSFYLKYTAKDGL
jgi:hypothetical protein